MNDLSPLSGETDTVLQQVIARTNYYQLREKLVQLQSALQPDMPAIDAVIRGLEKAQLAYKASHGLIGNNPIDD